MQKIIAFILSAYFIFLLAVPCCSFDNCPDEKTEQAANHDKGDGDCGNCSPFFTCTGCAGITLSSETPVIEVISFVPGHLYTGFILSSITDVHYDFWQPPKVG
jgi:hypothetical protein